MSRGPGSVPVPAGVTVDLISSATHQTYSTTTSTASGQFSFSSGSTGSALAPGWWGVWVPPQSNVTLNGAPYAVLPSNQSPQYYYENASELTTNVPVTIYGVQTVLYNATINGTVKYNGQPQGRAQISLLDPTYNGFVLAKNVTQTSKTNDTGVGWYNLSVPWGTYVLETYLPGSPGTYNYTQVMVGQAFTTVNPMLSSSKGYLVWGFGKLASGANVPSGGNVTVYDTQTGYIYSQVTTPGGFYSVGLAVPGTYDIILSFVGYSTAWFPVTVSASSPTGGSNPHDVTVTPIQPQASYTTTLDWSKGFGKLTVNTSATLLNDSVFPDLANASVGQLWAQLGLDWQQGLSFPASDVPNAQSWVQSAGPFFPAGQSDTMVNGSVYGQPNNATFTSSSSCSTGTCGLTSAAWLKLQWTQSYNVTPNPKLPTNSKSYSFSFNFRHPTNDQTFNYTILLPSGYVLASNAPVPTQTALVPDGHGGTWTSFTLVSKPFASPWATANFNAVKYGNVTAAVNVSSSTFTWSEKNVLNATHTNYTVVAGVGENLTFSALNSTFPANTNGTLYTWNFGDSTPIRNNTTGTIYHTYTTAGVFLGSVTVTSSADRTSKEAFRVFTGGSAPTAAISVNDTKVQTLNNVHYLIVNWSAALHFNATNSTSVLYSGAPVKGLITVAEFNISDYGAGSTTYNFTSSSGSDPFSNATMTFLGGGTVPHAGLRRQGRDGPGLVAGLAVQHHPDGLGRGRPQRDDDARRPREGHPEAGPRPDPQGAERDRRPDGGDRGGLELHRLRQVHVRELHRPEQRLDRLVQPDDHEQERLGEPDHLPPHRHAGGLAQLPRPVAGGPMAARAGRVVHREPDRHRPGRQRGVDDGHPDDRGEHFPAAVVVAENLTAPSSLTDGSSSTIWVNVTNTVGANSTAQNVSVRFYLLPPSGTGSQITLPGTVTYWGYTNGTLNSAPMTGDILIPYNHTIRAELSWNPARTGTWALWVNASASNEFAENYASGLNQAHTTVTLNANPIVSYEEYAAIAAAVVVVILAVVFWTRWRSKPSSKSGSGSGKLERGTSKKDKDDDDED